MKRRDVPWTSTEKAIFADALADGDSIATAARRAGRTKDEGDRQFARMEAALGELA